ncbi:tetratricopeptide repeat protein [Thermodesulfobacteriota bacterium]
MAICLSSEIEKGLHFHQQGQLLEAEKVYTRILSIAPRNADALHLMGVLANQKGENATALDLINNAVQIFPQNPIYQNNLGNIYRDRAQYTDALACYQQAIDLKPDLVEAFVNQGIAYHQLGDYTRATSAYQKALQLKPDSNEACYNMGNTLKAQGRFDDAIACYQQTLSLNPGFVEAYYNMANILEQRACPDEAIACLKQCLQINPEWAEVHNNIGNLLKQKGFLPEAILSLQKAIQIKPGLYEAHNNLGNALRDLGSFTEAIVCYHRALEIFPGFAEAYLNLGITLADDGRLNDAIGCFQKATRLNPRFAEAYTYMGVALTDQGKRQEAIDCLQKAIEVNPHYSDAYSYLIHQLQHTCNWPKLKMVSERLAELSRQKAVDGRLILEPPFICMSRQSELSRNLAISKAWSRKITEPLKNLKMPVSLENRRQPKAKITIGYLSCDFHNHATAHLMLSFFGLHDREKFEVRCYSYGPEDSSKYRHQIMEESDQFIDIRERSHIDAAKRIYADGVDILVDLKGHTQGARLGILACRPAPIQVHYLGYPGTTGADFIDYLITDRIVTPEDHGPFYSEKLVILPDCYQVNDHQQEIASRGWNRAALGLPDKGFVFSSFNLPYKIDPVMFDCWMRILQQVPNSVLWLISDTENARCNLRREAADRSIEPDRLVFAKKIEKAEHLSRLKWADLALDTRIVNGHTTTSDSLWVGVPVIALLGSHFASRVSSSLLHAVGLSELVTHHLEEYEKLSVRLATHPSELKAVRYKLNINRLKNPLFDTPRFVRNLEHAYSEMWRIFLEGRAPMQIEGFEV